MLEEQHLLWKELRCVKKGSGHPISARACYMPFGKHNTWLRESEFLRKKLEVFY